MLTVIERYVIKFHVLFIPSLEGIWIFITEASSNGPSKRFIFSIGSFPILVKLGRNEKVTIKQKWQ